MRCKRLANGTLTCNTSTVCSPKPAQDYTYKYGTLEVMSSKTGLKFGYLMFVVHISLSG